MAQKRNQTWRKLLGGDVEFDLTEEEEQHWPEKRARLIRRNVFKPNTKPYLFTTAEKMVAFTRELTQQIKSQPEAWKICEFCGKTPSKVQPIEERRYDLPPVLTFLGPEIRQLELYWTCSDCAETYTSDKPQLRIA